MTDNLPSQWAGGELSLETLMDGLDNTLMNVPTEENKSDTLYMKLTNGQMVVGKDNTPVGEGEQFAVHPALFSHGYIAWHGGKPEFKEVISSRLPLSSIQLPDPRTLKAKNGLELQRGMVMAGIDDDGEFFGDQIEFSSNSKGGREAIENVIKAIRDRSKEEGQPMAAIVTCGTTSYEHKEYGWVDKPNFTVSDFMTMDELAELMAGITPDEEPEPEPEPKKPTRRRRQG